MGLLIRLRGTGLLLEQPPRARAGTREHPTSPSRDSRTCLPPRDRTVSQNVPVPRDAPRFQVAGGVSPAFPQGRVGAPPPPVALPVRLLLAGAVLVLSLTVPREGWEQSVPGMCRCSWLHWG